MSFGGGPPMMSLLTGVAQGITEGQRDARDRQQHAVMQALRQAQIDETKAMMQLRREDAERDRELHELRLESQRLGNVMGAMEVEAMEQNEIQGRNARMSLAQQISEDRGISLAAAMQQADYHLKSGTPYIDKATEERDLADAASMRAARDAGTAATYQRMEFAEEDRDRAQGLEIFATNPILSRMANLDYNQFSAMISNYDPEQLMAETGLTPEQAMHGYRQARAHVLTSPQRIEGEANAIVSRLTGGGTISAQDALNKLQQDVMNGTLDLDRMTDAEAEAYNMAFDLLQRQANRRTSSNEEDPIEAAIAKIAEERARAGN